ncbi:carbohydrate-binding family 9-like protein [Paenibacillus sinopodophylli]|uniref:carbohydrate-binding family 9-like protein n=1 Tax=Paenibacillus sinopodophylli TaxID=1837342 RepID=UPI00110D0FE2|nr:carbohydrate-binding family 9-like protein [Paenibacillus sinopodophylli]
MVDAAMLRKSKTYYCKQMQCDPDNPFISILDWEGCEALELVETVTGAAPKEWTEVRLCWSQAYLHLRYLCNDSYVKSTFTKRDDPLYEQDVVELFIDESGTGTSYMELEVSPHNIVFDAMIAHDGAESVIGTDLSWRLEGLQTVVERLDDYKRIYTIHIPVGNFQRPFEPGQIWRVNFYRIDEDEAGTREYQAWQATDVVNFHLPRKFGTLQFIS